MASIEEVANERLKAAGLGNAELVGATSDSRSFGDASAVFRVGSVLVRFTRERGQEFVDLAFEPEPTSFYQFGDIEIAMGRRTIVEVLAKREPEAVEDVLCRLKEFLVELECGLTRGRWPMTRARIKRAERDRGDAFVRRLRQ